PQAMPTILSGVILSIGRVIGESAALVMIFGVASRGSVSEWTTSGGTTLATEIYGLTKQEIIPWDLVKTIGIVIMAIVLILAILSSFIENKQYKKALLITFGLLLILFGIIIGGEKWQFGYWSFLLGIILIVMVIINKYLFLLLEYGRLKYFKNKYLVDK
ncbi:MAG: hypothetical protein GQ557_00140, partial [Mycoplasmataceae bacterium]|nr:hypothetical protein [Mycoplasmataceae bacterium]